MTALNRLLSKADYDQKIMLKKTLLLITLSLTLAPQVLLTTAATATPSNTNLISQRTQPRFTPRRRSLLRFKVPGIRGSRNLEAGAARGQCTPQAIGAVLPAKPTGMSATEIPIELTLSDRPTFFVNVPETSAQQAAFLLRNESGDEILLEKTLPLKASNGIMSYALPDDFPGLEVGKKYRWRFSLLCDATGGDRSGDPVASGWIERVKPDAAIAAQLQTSTPKQQVLIYAENGYWHDTLKALADLRTEKPSDFTLVRDWVDLFKSAGLSAIANRPLISLQAD